ncbi:hypothetical protein MA13_contig00006-0007 [Edwardsiella piscicida]|nr:hypothetical protein MA13_contig00006-0007 [Edwardsiella piscicida]
MQFADRGAERGDLLLKLGEFSLGIVQGSASLGYLFFLGFELILQGCALLLLLFDALLFFSNVLLDGL